MSDLQSGARLGGGCPALATRVRSSSRRLSRSGAGARSCRASSASARAPCASASLSERRVRPSCRAERRWPSSASFRSATASWLRARIERLPGLAGGLDAPAFRCSDCGCGRLRGRPPPRGASCSAGLAGFGGFTLQVAQAVFSARRRAAGEGASAAAVKPSQRHRSPSARPAAGRASGPRRRGRPPCSPRRSGAGGAGARRAPGRGRDERRTPSGRAGSPSPARRFAPNGAGAEALVEASRSSPRPRQARSRSPSATVIWSTAGGQRSPVAEVTSLARVRASVSSRCALRSASLSGGRRRFSASRAAARVSRGLDHRLFGFLSAFPRRIAASSRRSSRDGRPRARRRAPRSRARGAPSGSETGGALHLLAHGTLQGGAAGVEIGGLGLEGAEGRLGLGQLGLGGCEALLALGANIVRPVGGERDLGGLR